MTALRAAAYARYSTDRQNPLSTQDQLEKSRQYARERGLHFLEAFVFTDEEMSGAHLSGRGYGSSWPPRNQNPGRSMFF